MSWWKSKKPTSELLASVGVPRPESLMVSMILLRMSKLEPGEEYRKNHLRLSYSLGDRNDLETNFSVDNLGFPEIRIGVTGPPNYRTIILTSEEKKQLTEQWNLLRRQSRELNELRLEHESQDAALQAIDHLLMPVDFDHDHTT